MLDRFAASSPVRAVSVSIALNVFKGYVIKSAETKLVCCLSSSLCYASLILHRL